MISEPLFGSPLAPPQGAPARREGSLSFECDVVHVVFQNPDTGFRILKTSVQWAPGKIETLTVKGAFPSVPVGARVRVEGTWVNDPKYGDQVKAETVTELAPTTLRGVERYLAAIVAGIGEKTAQRIVETFGEETLPMLEHAPERLLGVKGIKPETVELVKEAWVKHKKERELAVFLMARGFTLALAMRIWGKYGAKAMEVLNRNPYQLSYDVEGIGFATADELAIATGIERTSPFRLEAGILQALAQETEEGHAFTEIETLAEKSRELLDLDETDIHVSRLVKAAEHAESTERLVLETVQGQRLAFKPGVLRAEERIATRLVELVRAPVANLETREPETPQAGGASPAGRPIEREGGSLEEVPLPLASPQGSPSGEDSRSLCDRAMATFEAESGVTLAPEQREAVRLAARSSVMVLTGGPGVGKTTIVKAILTLLGLAGVTTRLAAPTGRAAKRMTEMTGHEPAATTLHRLLEYDPVHEKFKRNASSPLTVDAIVIDETSMLDLYLADALFQAVRPGMRVILVGDVDQLPSVDVGAVLRDILSSRQIPSVRLTKIFRQAEKSYIITNAHRINRGEAPIDPDRERRKTESPQAGRASPLFRDREARPAGRLKGEKCSRCGALPDVQCVGECPFFLAPPQGAPAAEASDFFLIQGVDPVKAAERIVEFVVKRIPEKFGLDPRRDIQVLTPMHKGPAGTEALNQALQQALNPSGEAWVRGSGESRREFRCGDKVMQLKNDHDHLVYNGEIGIVSHVDAEAGELYVLFDGDREVAYSSGTLSSLGLAYAQSIHKSQGNEYPATVIAFLKSHYMMLSRNLLYTAVTRGKKLVVLVCDPRAIAMALSMERKEDRRSRLSTRIVRGMRT